MPLEELIDELSKPNIEVLKPWEEEIDEDEKIRRIDKKRREIEELKTWELNLSEEDKRKREEYKFNVASGKYVDPDTGEESNYYGPLVGYSSIDKPQLKYYDREKYFEEKPKKTVTEQLFDSSKDNPEGIATEFFGTEISFGEFHDNIIKTAKAFDNYGVKKGDTVTLCLTSVPESMYSFYAMGYLGAVGMYIPPYVSTEKMVSDINAKNSKVLVVLDVLYDQIRNKIKNTTIEKVIIVPTLNSVKETTGPKSLKRKEFSMRLAKKKIKDPKREILWNDFIDEAKYKPIPEIVKYEKDMPLSIVYSSGTSGNIKGILLSHDSYQNSVLSYSTIGVDLSAGQKLYHIIPDWTSTGTSTCMHLPLIHKCCVFLDPRYKAKIFAKNISEKNIDYAIGTTGLFEGFEKKKNIGENKFPNLHYPYVVGTPITNKKIRKIEKIFNDHGCFAGLLIAYGSCENGAAVTTETPATGHKPGSVGIAIPGVNIMIVDDDGNELPYGERGHIMVLSPCRMLKYHNNDKLTEEYWFVDKNDLKWSRTGDIGYVGTDGILYYSGRANDVSVINGEKIYNFDIKSIIMEDPNISDCEVVSKNIHGNDELCVHIIFEKKLTNYMNVIRDIQERLYNTFNNYNMVPQCFKFRIKFPMAKSTKRDMPAIRREKWWFVHINFEKGKQKKLIS